ncbi:MAG: chemotaxis protein CheW [Planctomycetia bacterium]
MLLLHAGGQRYALPSAHVVEVVPSVALRQVPGTPPEVAGLLHYRGQVVPVVDLCARLGAPPPPATFATRIVVCLRPRGAAGAGTSAGGDAGRDGALDAGEAGEPGQAPARRLLGVRAGDVTRVGVVDPDAPGSHAGVLPDGLRALGRVTRDEEGLVQLVDLEGLLGASLLARLDGEAAAGGAAGGAAGTSAGARP